ncbi:ArsR family transcriptional regulator [Micromonospora sp. WMMD1102]|uniref:arsenate reductase/protein-tyrosine-phosphatase family protein n=1 Tax=Micromonospora sp. WMMD1102 TaxID=3016105 RepID=UPI0024156EDA|nr:ArsR family transcriptional regulator [Micromonospora sp. WMMD1102]MDG4788830.1 ArsR family transcriptional regulator [Micromonospora sp. WMMD1102]
MSRQSTPTFVRLTAHPLRWRLLTELATGDLRVRELVALVGEPQNLVSYHLRLLRDGGLVTAVRSSYDGRDSYYHLDLDRCANALADTGAALHPALRRESAPLPVRPVDLRRTPRVSVLFVCTGNSARSPIAEALLRHHTDGQVETISAGGSPRSRLHPGAARVLRREFGVRIADQLPRHWDTVAGRRFDYVISLCDRAREKCPDFSGGPRRVHWSIPDPAADGDPDQVDHSALQRAAVDIDTRVRRLLPVLCTTRP